MTKTVLQIESIEAGELLTSLDRIESAITALARNSQPPAGNASQSGYITRSEVAELFKITLTTVNDWTRKGILQAYKIGNRVYYKASEVEHALIKKRNRRDITNG